MNEVPSAGGGKTAFVGVTAVTEGKNQAQSGYI